ncbi:hypothetical protein Pelo_14198 [Pelomyxa schiedti]|nr:hypothetical protein Pelo_14198 [Pelomyxa schiedti]
MAHIIDDEPLRVQFPVDVQLVRRILRKKGWAFATFSTPGAAWQADLHGIDIATPHNGPHRLGFAQLAPAYTQNGEPAEFTLQGGLYSVIGVPRTASRDDVADHFNSVCNLSPHPHPCVLLSRAMDGLRFVKLMHPPLKVSDWRVGGNKIWALPAGLYYTRRPPLLYTRTQQLAPPPPPPPSSQPAPLPMPDTHTQQLAPAPPCHPAPQPLHSLQQSIQLPQQHQQQQQQISQPEAPIPAQEQEETQSVQIQSQQIQTQAQAEAQRQTNSPILPNQDLSIQPLQMQTQTTEILSDVHSKSPVPPNQEVLQIQPPQTQVQSQLQINGQPEPHQTEQDATTRDSLMLNLEEEAEAEAPLPMPDTHTQQLAPAPPCHPAPQPLHLLQDSSIQPPQIHTAESLSDTQSKSPVQPNQEVLQIQPPQTQVQPQLPIHMQPEPHQTEQDATTRDSLMWNLPEEEAEAEAPLPMSDNYLLEPRRPTQGSANVVTARPTDHTVMAQSYASLLPICVIHQIIMKA